MPRPAHEGGCLCGAVRYRATGEAYNVGYCHCGTCRKAAGAPVVVWATFLSGQFEFRAGDPTRYESSPRVARTFCGRCGTSLTYQKLDTPEEIDISVSTLDAPGRLQPEFHIWVSQRLPWLRMGDALPEYAEER